MREAQQLPPVQHREVDDGDDAYCAFTCLIVAEERRDSEGRRYKMRIYSVALHEKEGGVTLSMRDVHDNT